MRSNRGRDTRPELALRRRLHAAGLRYRTGRIVAVHDLRARPDIIFVRARVAVFVDGCFWHGCVAHRTIPVRNHAFWAAKLAANVARDRRQDQALVGSGWEVIRVWEHDRVEDAAVRIERSVRRRPGSARTRIAG